MKEAHPLKGQHHLINLYLSHFRDHINNYMKEVASNTFFLSSSDGDTVKIQIGGFKILPVMSLDFLKILGSLESIHLIYSYLKQSVILVRSVY